MIDVTLPMGKGGTFPTEPGAYVVWQKFNSRPMVLGWAPQAGQRDWRQGAFKIEASAWMGPLPKEFPQ